MKAHGEEPENPESWDGRHYKSYSRCRRHLQDSLTFTQFHVPFSVAI